MSPGLLASVYLVAGLLFVGSLAGLSSQESARRGNALGVLGMALAIVATALHPDVRDLLPVLAPLAVGGLIGALVAARVAMTQMPELVALLHSFVGLAAVLVGVSSYLRAAGHGAPPESHPTVHLVEIWLGVLIGMVTFTGSVVAWGKLRGVITGRPLLLPGRHLLNALALGACLAAFLPFHGAPIAGGLLWLGVMVAVSGLLGAHLVLAIGGADMPVVVSLLNSYSGWAAAAAGFTLSNDLLIITGALVGSSGAILSIIMCRAMNRSIVNVVFGGFGATRAEGGSGGGGTVRSISAAEAAAMLESARSVVIVPGYGLAVARGQHLARELTDALARRGVEVRYAIHPVAGRLPGHMNVLLAEAGVPYDIVHEMDEINEDFPETDVVIVVGANDIVNPSARTDPESPIAGMPVLEVWKAGRVIVLKRGMGTGYAGVQNPLFYMDDTRMLFGDARESLQEILANL